MARPKAPARKPAVKPAPPSDDDGATVLSVRIAPSKVAALDVWVGELNAAPDNPGRVTRNSLIVHIIDGALKARGSSGPT